MGADWEPCFRLTRLSSASDQVPLGMSVYLKRPTGRVSWSEEKGQWAEDGNRLIGDRRHQDLAVSRGLKRAREGCTRLLMPFLTGAIKQVQPKRTDSVPTCALLGDLIDRVGSWRMWCRAWVCVVL